MPKASVNNVEIEYESHGPDTAPVFVFIAGLGSQLISWNPEFIELFVDAGYRVITFDNRDVGKSTYFDQAGKANFSDPTQALAYTLDDMAADTIGLIESVAGGKANVLGVSLGGMIAQVAAYTRPDVVESVALIMTTTGNSTVGQATEEAAAFLLKGSANEREAFIESAWQRFQTNGFSPAFEESEEYIRARAGRAYDRAYHPEGNGRQLAAVLSHGDRTEKLGDIKSPTVVIHGSVDKLIDVSGGEAAANAIPDAELVIIDGMGHHIPKDAYAIVAEQAIKNAKRA